MLRFINWLGSPCRLANGAVVGWFQMGMIVGFVIGVVLGVCL